MTKSKTNGNGNENETYELLYSNNNSGNGGAPGMSNIMAPTRATCTRKRSSRSRVSRRPHL